MKAVVYHGIGYIRLEDAPEPKLEAPTDAIVRLTASAICGTDLHILKGDVPTCQPGTTLGHEDVGVIDSVVPGVDAISLAFDPFVDSFGFFNYGGEEGVVNLTPVEMQRMFGSDLCANVANGCTLTPPARQWMMQMNEAMAGGPRARAPSTPPPQASAAPSVHLENRVPELGQQRLRHAPRPA